MQPVSLDWARIPRGGAGVELWFQVSTNKQVRISMESRRIETRFWTADVIALFQRISFKPVFVVAYIGAPEPKTPWWWDTDHNLKR